MATTRKYRTKELTDLELQDHPEEKGVQLLYIGTKEFIYKDGKFYMDFADTEVLKNKKQEAKEANLKASPLDANGNPIVDKKEEARILMELMQNAKPVRFEYTITV